MSVSVYSFITAFIWFDAFVVLCWVLRRKLDVFLRYNIGPLLFLIALTLTRLFVPFEPSFAYVLRVDGWAPRLQDALREPVALGQTLTLPLWGVLLLIAAAGTVIFLLHLMAHIRRVQRTALTLDEWEPPEIRQMMQEIMANTGGERPYTIVCSLGNDTPKTVGYRHPTIIPPANIETFSAEDQYNFLRHEWQHFLDKDLWVKLLVELLRCLTWWNPFVYLLRYHVSQTLELKCDVRVTAHMDKAGRRAYLEALYNALESFVQEKRQLVSLSFVGTLQSWMKTHNRFDVEQRFKLVQKFSERNQMTGKAFFSVLTVLFLASFCFVLQPYYDAPPTEDIVELGESFPAEANLRVHTPTTDTAYLVDNKDGTFTMHVDNAPSAIFTQEDIEFPPLNSLPIRESEN